jgi:hypothetical protein
MKALLMVTIGLIVGLQMGCSSSPEKPPVLVPTDCAGAWSACEGPCGIWGAKQTYQVSVQASNGGKACEIAEGAVKICTASVCPQGKYCVSGGGFSPCAPHFPAVDEPCVLGQTLESDCKMWTCKESCN